MNRTLALALISAPLLAACGTESLDGVRRDAQGATTAPDGSPLPENPAPDSDSDVLPHDLPPPPTCQSSPAPLAFTRGLCVCEDFAHSGRVHVAPGSPSASASMGVNGDVSLAAEANIEGDLCVGGDLAGAGVLVVGGVLRVAGNETVSGTLSVGAREDYASFDAPPCPCEATGALDLESRFAYAASVNDNAAAALPSQLASAGALTLHLASGRYYFSSLAAAGGVRLEVDGAVELYVDGPLSLAGDDAVQLAAGAVLDLYVAGAFSHAGSLTLGDPAAPEALRIYLRGEAGATLAAAGEQHIFGSLFAPRAAVALAGATELHGALVVRTLTGAGELDVVYAEVTGGPDLCADEVD